MAVLNNSIPFITGYARIIDRVTNKPLTGFIETLKSNNEWNLGVIHNFYGGYSQFVVEFDIWNNEPDISEGATQLIFEDAKDCNLTIKYNDSIFSTMPIIQFKDTTLVDNNFINISDINNITLSGNLDNSKKGVLHGKGDHTKFQIGVKIPEGEPIHQDEIKFKIIFQYKIGSTINDLEFNCYINIINYINPLIVIKQNEFGSVPIGNIINNNGEIIRINAYNQDGYLQDQCLTNNDYFPLFLTEGKYRISMSNSIKDREFNDIEIKNGILRNYIDFENTGLLYRIYDDVHEYLHINNLNKTKIKKLISGTMVDEYNNPLEKSEIIITQDDKVIVYFVTEKDGKYKFYLRDGLYDIRIRHKNRNVKIFKNIELSQDKGFFNQICKLDSKDFSINY